MFKIKLLGYFFFSPLRAPLRVQTAASLKLHFKATAVRVAGDDIMGEEESL